MPPFPSLSCANLVSPPVTCCNSTFVCAPCYTVGCAVATFHVLALRLAFPGARCETCQGEPRRWDEHEGEAHQSAAEKKEQSLSKGTHLLSSLHHLTFSP